MFQYLRTRVYTSSSLLHLFFPRGRSSCSRVPWISRNSERRAVTRSIHVPVVSCRFYAVHRHWNSRNCRKIYSGYSTASESFFPSSSFYKGQTSSPISLQRGRYRFKNVWKTLAVESRRRSQSCFATLFRDSLHASRSTSPNVVYMRTEFVLNRFGKVFSRQICLSRIWNFISFEILRSKVLRRPKLGQALFGTLNLNFWHCFSASFLVIYNFSRSAKF